MHPTEAQKLRYSRQLLKSCKAARRNPAVSDSDLIEKINRAIAYCSRFAHYHAEIAQNEIRLSQMRNLFIQCNSEMSQFKADEWSARLRREKALKDAELPNCYDRIKRGAE